MKRRCTTSRSDISTSPSRPAWIWGTTGSPIATPDADRDTFTILEKAGEPEAALADRLRGWAGFRNILVHEYLDIDHAIAYRAIRDELGDLGAFAAWAAAKLTG